MQCEDCQHGLRNQGRVIPVQEKSHFCRMAGEVRDHVASALLEDLLLMSARDGRCPRFKAFESFPDSYRAKEIGHGTR